jgi:uncharacterized integral membrane protein (TIGR00697 family)
MFNEIFFFIQVGLVLAFTIWAARLGAKALAALIVLEGVLANLFVVKQTDLFGLTVTCSDVFAVGCILGLNLMQEFFGKQAAQKTIQISFVSMIFFVLVSQIHLAYRASNEDPVAAAFSQILHFTPRIVLASILVFFLSQKFDVLFFGYLKKVWQSRYLPLRMGLSLGCSQLLDTLLFSFAALYGIAASLFDVIAMSFAVKCLVIACSAPFAAFAKRFIKQESAP